jgi:G3E family GTPase
MNKTKLILVGGFLAAGKTTMLNALAGHLTERGFQVGLITNDQAADLVDTAILTRTGVEVREVSGSCFCCNFPGFMKAVESLIDAGCNMIVAEPVGSCTDLSATILQPIKDMFPDLDLAPLTVLVDPVRLKEALELVRTLTHPDALYIVKRQLEEADRILLNKIDTLSDAQIQEELGLLKQNFTAPATAVSALQGTGVDAWLDEILAGGRPGTHLTEVDYDRYAHGEAVLGWLNAAINLTGAQDTDWSPFAESLLAKLKDAFLAVNAEIGHVKLSLICDGSVILGNVGSIGGAVNMRADSAVKGASAVMTLNARVQMSPDDLQKTVETILPETAAAFGISASITNLKCLMPGRPNPTYRYKSVI